MRSNARKRTFALTGKLTLMSRETERAQGELHVIGYFRHAQMAIPSLN
jgi:hypothetical protein